MTIAEATWIATALLHQENSSAQDFSVAEIKEKAKKEGLVSASKSGLSVHVSKHCVANKSANSMTHRMLFKTTTGRRRLFKLGDEFHADRAVGKIRPTKEDIPSYGGLVDWYDKVYSNPTATPDSPLQTSPGSDVGREDKGATGFANEILRIFAGKVTVNGGGTVAIPEFLRRELGIAEGTLLSTYREGNRLVLQPINEAFIRELMGSGAGDLSLLEAREREHRIEKDRS